MTGPQKKLWVAPTIAPLRSGMLNKFGTARYSPWSDTFEGVSIANLVRQFGSPLFCISERKLRENARRLRRAFTSRYPRVQIGWSYKTNYLGAVCNTLHQEGALAEVVSTFEYEKARALGVPGHAIIFNGPHKPRAILERAVADGARIHIDHLDELYLLEEVAQAAQCKVDVAIRLNFDTGFTESWSRFGFNVESGQAMDAAWRIASSAHLQLAGLHCHIGTFIVETRAYAAAARVMCNFMREVEEKTHCRIRYLDLGGGFASLNALQGVYLPPEQTVPSLDQYAEAICSTLLAETHERAARVGERPTLVLETGRAVVDDTEILVASVIANKRLPDGRRGVVLDAGVNLLFTGFWYNHQVQLTRPLSGRMEETVLYGPLCMNIDAVRHSVQLPPLEIGEPVVIGPVGAYNNTQWLQFIEYRPNVVMIHDGGAVSVVRRAEDLATMTAQEDVPEHLRDPQLGGERRG